MDQARVETSRDGKGNGGQKKTWATAISMRLEGEHGSKQAQSKQKTAGSLAAAPGALAEAAGHVADDDVLLPSVPLQCSQCHVAHARPASSALTTSIQPQGPS